MADKQYLDNAKFILEHGEVREDRTGTGTISVFSPPEMRFDLRKGFPLLTTKKVHVPSVVHELLWFLKGSTNVRDLQKVGVKIWDADYERWQSQRGVWTDDGELGPIYGEQWRSWKGRVRWNEDGGTYAMKYDQIKYLIDEIKNNPQGRRHIVSAWNIGDMHDMALPPCHVLFQAYVHNDGGLSLKMYQR